MSQKTSEKIENIYPWINPVGGYGDMLIVSGVLKRVFDKDPSRKYNLVRRTSYYKILNGHPAIVEYGYPPKGAEIQSVNYWHMEKLGPGIRRPYQVLSRAFGLETPVDEGLFIPDEIEDDPILHNFIPWKKKNVLIAPTSDSPRKIMKSSLWEPIVQHLQSDGMFIIQVGRLNDPLIRNAYSVRGLTTPQELVALVRKCDLVITSDNFILHAAHLAGVKTVALWGPTHHLVYGYPEQFHIQPSRPCGLGIDEECIGPSRNDGGKLYATPCPLKEIHCIDQITEEEVYNAVQKVL